MSRERRSLWLSVAGIAFMFFICPPTGIALGILRGRYEYKTAQGKRTGLRIAGGITMAVFFLLVYVQLFMNPDPPPYSEVLIIAGVLYFLPGLSMIRAGNRVIKRAEKKAAVRQAEWEASRREAERRAAIRAEQWEAEWNEQWNVIAEQAKQENAKLWEEQKELIRDMSAIMSDFEKEHAYAHSDTAPRGAEANSATSRRANSAERKKEQLPKMITCSGCGAQSRVNPNSSVVCSYCGSTISYR